MFCDHFNIFFFFFSFRSAFHQHRFLAGGADKDQVCEANDAKVVFLTTFGSVRSDFRLVLARERTLSEFLAKYFFLNNRFSCPRRRTGTPRHSGDQSYFDLFLSFTPKLMVMKDGEITETEKKKKKTSVKLPGLSFNM